MSSPLGLDPLPSTCKGAVTVNEGANFHVEIQDLPVPEPGSGEVLIRLNASGICLSDVHFMLNDTGLPKMSANGVRCAGHEGAGVIVQLGPNVTNLKVGQRASIKSVKDVCHICEECRAGRDNYCSKSIYYGWMVDGSFKQYVVAVERYITLIPDGVSDFLAAPLMCSGATIYRALKDSRLEPGQWAVFPGGGGGVGIMGIQLAAAMGYRPLAVDTGEDRMRMCLENGAEAFVDFKSGKDPVQSVLKLTHGGAHAVFVTAYQAYPIAHKYLGSRVGAKIMCIALPPTGTYGIAFPPEAVIMRGQSFTGSLIGTLSDLDQVLEFARRGKLRYRPTVIGLSEVNDAVQKLKNGQVAGRLVIDFQKQ